MKREMRISVIGKPNEITDKVINAYRNELLCHIGKWMHLSLKAKEEGQDILSDALWNIALDYHKLL